MTDTHNFEHLDMFTQQILLGNEIVWPLLKKKIKLAVWLTN